MGRNENAAVHGRRKKMIRYGIPNYAMREKLTRKKGKKMERNLRIKTKTIKGGKRKIMEGKDFNHEVVKRNKRKRREKIITLRED